MSPVRIPSLTIQASNRRTGSVSVGWARSSRRAASAFMTTALIGWLISAIDADSCPRIPTVRGRQLRLSFVTARRAVARGLLRGAPRPFGGNGAGLAYGVGHGTPPNLGGVAAPGGRFLRADLKN